MLQISFSESEKVVLADMRLFENFDISELIRLIKIFSERLTFIVEKVMDYKSEARKKEIIYSRFLLCLLANLWGAKIEYFDNVLKEKINCEPVDNPTNKEKLMASISHSYNWLAVGLSSRGSVGIDIHSLEKGVEKVFFTVKKIFPELFLEVNDERKYILAWTLYESFIKIGINDVNKIVPVINRFSEGVDVLNKVGRFRDDGYSFIEGFFNLYGWFLESYAIVGSMVVNLDKEAKEKGRLRVYLVEKVSPRECLFTRALNMGVILEI